jgi:phosphate transport system permease protein
MHPGPETHTTGTGEGGRSPSPRRTAGWVRLQDRIAAVVISAGGLIVLLAMLGICVFLVVSAAPLFAPGKVTGEIARYDLRPTDRDAAPPLWMSVDRSFSRTVALDADGVFRVRDLESGEPLAALPALPGDAIPTSIRAEAGEGWISLTEASGALSLVRPVFSWEPVQDRGDTPGEPGTFIRAFEDGSLRLWTMSIERLGPFAISLTARAADTRGKSDRQRSVAAIDDSGVIAGELAGRRALGGKVRFRWSADDASVSSDLLGSLPDWVFATSDGRWVYLAWRSGRLAAIDREASGDEPPVHEPSVDDGLAPITAAAMSLGAQTLLVGDESGTISGWSVYGEPAKLQPRLRRTLGDAPITAIRPGDRDRTFVVGFADGSAVMFNQVSRKRIATIRPEGLGSVAYVAASPGSDVFLAVDESGLASVWGVEPGHVESSFEALFARLPYEGYDEPAFVYQSTGSASAEPKYSLIPLIWGTLKATIVAMLFAVPLAVLAAIYSGEFLHHDVRKFVKPTIELMASLPSVVLGFMAAMVVAPFVRDQLPRVLVLGLTAPVVVVVCAHAWRMIPRDTRARWGTLGQTVMILAATVLALLLAVPTGPWVEAALFSPDGGGEASIRGWLDRDFGGPTPGWFIALLPVVAGVVLLLDGTLVNPAWRTLSDRWQGMLAGLGSNAIEFLRFLVNLGVSVVAAQTIATVLGELGFDPRDSIFGPFSQRNTLVVGLIMGIAVIPIIYTISEDAIRSVPGSLRSASLGVGATPWQTAVRVVLPVAGSGIFSACMVGLGRAVGETMIVLMATGNTPEMSWNIFSGFRTLAANIAVELPEAPRASTHYRVLFLCGLVLFAMTLVINTSAELVRQHFRKKNAAL